MKTGRTVVLCAAFFSSSMAVAQNAPHHNYRITDLGDFDPLIDAIGHSFGLNDLGQVV